MYIAHGVFSCNDKLKFFSQNSLTFVVCALNRCYKLFHL